MSFHRTLRLVQATRALTIVFACISVIMFSFTIDMRFKARLKFIGEIQNSMPGVFENQPPTRSSFGTLALLGLAVSLIWNALCLFDLSIKKHYRFDRRVCIFVDMLMCIALLATGFLNFAYDALLYFALGIAESAQVRLEIAAVAFLGASCILHFGFFCYGCKDPAGPTLAFEQVPYDAGTPILGHGDYDTKNLRSRATTIEKHAIDMVEIDLGHKVQVVRVQQQSVDDAISPRTPQEEMDTLRIGYVRSGTGTPRQIEPEISPFVDERHIVRHQEWI